jgi:hypothetical protein
MSKRSCLIRGYCCLASTFLGVGYCFYRVKTDCPSLADSSFWVIYAFSVFTAILGFVLIGSSQSPVCPIKLLSLPQGRYQILLSKSDQPTFYYIVQREGRNDWRLVYHHEKLAGGMIEIQHPSYPKRLIVARAE